MFQTPTPGVRKLGSKPMSRKELQAFLRVMEGAHDEERLRPASGVPPAFFVSVADKGLTPDAARKGDE